MSQSFPAGDTGKSLKWAVLIAFTIDIPFLAFLLISRGESRFVSLLIMILPLAISGLIIYSSYAAGKMVYILEKEEFRINFILSPTRIRYEKIRNARKTETTLRFRLFGGSLPGSHWGIFTTSGLGNAQVYSTKYKGEFVLLELVDGTRMLISPKNPDAFIEALSKKTSFSSSVLTTVEEPSSNQKAIYAQIAIVVAAWLLLVFYVASVYPELPEIIPVHFGFDGLPNRYGSKSELFILVAVAAIFPTLNAIFSLKFGKYNKGLTLFLNGVFLLSIGLFALVVNQILQAI